MTDGEVIAKSERTSARCAPIFRRRSDNRPSSKTVLPSSDASHTRAFVRGACTPIPLRAELAWGTEGTPEAYWWDSQGRCTWP